MVRTSQTDETIETLITPGKKLPYLSRIEGRPNHLAILQKGFPAEFRFLGHLSRDHTRTHRHHTRIFASLSSLCSSSVLHRHGIKKLPPRQEHWFNSAWL